ncbi:MAG: hypothetical protein JSU68_00620 [Phycisphaerales bacterium]|nr:MAG: hypothetical protein JSU68_00620 [Phycisphaerales bacterium]
MKNNAGLCLAAAVVITASLAVASAWPAAARSATPAGGLHFDPADGQVAHYVYGGRVTLNTQVARGEQRSTQQLDIKTEWACRVERLEADNSEEMLLRFTLLWLSRRVTGPGLHAAFDSRREKTAEGPMGSALASLLGKPVVLKLDAQGRVTQMPGADQIVRAAKTKAPEMWRDSIEGLLDPRSLEHKIGAYLVAGAPAEAAPGAEWKAEYRDPLDARSSVRAELQCRFKQTGREETARVAHIQATGELKSAEPLTSQPVSQDVRTEFLGGWLDGHLTWNLERNRLSSAIWTESSKTEVTSGQGAAATRTLIMQDSTWTFVSYEPQRDQAMRGPSSRPEGSSAEPVTSTGD